MPAFEGRLELTWSNKSLRLPARQDGSHEWIPPSDFRIAEVRLLHAISSNPSTISSGGIRVRHPSPAPRDKGRE